MANNFRMVFVIDKMYLLNVRSKLGWGYQPLTSFPVCDAPYRSKSTMRLHCSLKGDASRAHYIIV